MDFRSFTRMISFLLLINVVQKGARLVNTALLSATAEEERNVDKRDEEGWHEG
jgi:hypothetical protein